MDCPTFATPALALLLWFAALTAFAADPTIVVHRGSFPTPQAAAYGEATLDWRGTHAEDETACTECFAADELRNHLRLAIGGDPDTAFPIVDDRTNPAGDLILIGSPDHNAATARFAGQLKVSAKEIAALGPDGYVIRAAADGNRRILLIAGGGRSGTLYGVYDYLYRAGYRWFAPDPLQTDIPTLKAVPLDGFAVRERPAIRFRGFYAWQNRGHEDFFLWMARNRLNLWCAEEHYHPLLRKLGICLTWGSHYILPRYLHPDNPYPYNHANFTGDDSRPADPYPVSKEYRGDANGDGVLSCGEAHPEWFYFTKGKRVLKMTWSGPNYCTSNPDATAELMRNLIAELSQGEAADADIVNFWTADGGKWCECQACSALGTSTDRYLRLVRALDQAIKQGQKEGKIRRTVTIHFLVYADVLAPPTRPLPEGFDNTTCVGTFYPISRCYVHNLADPVCPRNQRYIKMLDGWIHDPGHFYQGGLVIGEYYNVSGYRGLQVVFMHRMATDIPFYCDRAKAIDFHYMHVTTHGWGPMSLTNVQMARQLWDPKMDCSSFWDDFFARRYGPAADKMREVYVAIETMLSNVTVLKYVLPRRLSTGLQPLFNDPHMLEKPGDEKALGPSFAEIMVAAARADRALTAARAIELAPQLAGRIDADRRGFDYAYRTLRFYEALARTDHAVREKKTAEACAALAEAKHLAELLRAEKSVESYSYLGSEGDALKFSGAEPALGRLQKAVDRP